jgi:hypothetical protein
MTWLTCTCVEVTCDHCGDGWDTPHPYSGRGDSDEDGVGVRHFADQAEALRVLAEAGWALDPARPGEPDQLGHHRDGDGVAGPRVWCPACVIRLACHGAGHMWLAWHTSATGRYRLCGRCDDGQWEPHPIPSPGAASVGVDG